MHAHTRTPQNCSPYFLFCQSTICRPNCITKIHYQLNIILVTFIPFLFWGLWLGAWPRTMIIFLIFTLISILLVMFSVTATASSCVSSFGLILWILMVAAAIPPQDVQAAVSHYMMDLVYFYLKSLQNFFSFSPPGHSHGHGTSMTTTRPPGW